MIFALKYNKGKEKERKVQGIIRILRWKKK